MIGIIIVVVALSMLMGSCILYDILVGITRKGNVRAARLLVLVDNLGSGNVEKAIRFAELEKRIIIERANRPLERGANLAKLMELEEWINKNK